MAVKKTNIKNISDENYAKFDFGLICEEKYKSLKHIDMVVFTVLNNQHGLSVKNTLAGSRRFVDSNGYVFVSIGQDKLCKLLRTTRPTLLASIKRLEEVELIEMKSTGNMKCNKIYIGEIERTITLGDYMNTFNISGEDDDIPTINATNIDKIKAPTFGEVEGDENKNSIDNNSICNKDNNNTSSIKNKVENVANKLTEVEKAIKESNVNIRKEDLKECNETFTNIDVLVKALGLVESDRGHGIKALRGAYKKVMGLVTPSNKGYLNNNSMTIDGKKLSDYTEEEFNKMVEEKQKVFKPTFTNTPKVEGESFK